MFKEYKAERGRQKAYAEEATGVFGERLGGATADVAGSQMETGAKQRLAEFANIAKLRLAPTNNLVMTPQDKASFETTTKSRAKLGSYSDWALKQAIQDIRTQQELNRITSFAGGTAQVFPFKSYDAQHEYDWLANLGAAIQGSSGAVEGFYGAPHQGSVPQTSQGSGASGAPSYYEGDINIDPWTKGMV